MFGNNDGKLMNGVKIKSSELLFILENNLSHHKDDIQEAIELRRNEIILYFKQKLEVMESDESYSPKESINFPLPKDSSSDYEKAIRMVQLTQDEIIELNEDQFDKLVMDNWEWKQSLVATSAFYGKAM